MPPRWVQSKLIKMKKDQRKAALIRPRSGGVDTSKLGTYEIFQNRNRVNTIVGRKGENLPLLRNTWMNEIPETKSLVVNDVHTLKCPRHIKLGIIEALKAGMKTKQQIVEYLIGKYNLDFDIWAPKALTKEASLEYKNDEEMNLVEKLFKAWQGIRYQGVSTFQKVDMGGCTMYFSGNDFVFVTENETTRWISIMYKGREEALKAYHKRISWKLTLSKSNTD